MFGSLTLSAICLVGFFVWGFSLFVFFILQNFKLCFSNTKCDVMLKNMPQEFFNKQIMSVLLPRAKAHSVNRNNYFVVI